MDKPVILMVEDDAGLSTMLTLTLEDAGYAVQVAGNGVEALEYLTRVRPGLILLDLRMPVMDGPTFLRAAQDRYRVDLPPVILMTAYRDIDPEIVQLGLPMINKPMKIDLLLTMIAQHTAQR